MLRAEKVRLEENQKQFEQEWDAARTRVAQVEDHLRLARQTLQEMREERGRFEIDKARNDSDRQHLRETCLTEVNAQPEDLIASETAFMSGDELAMAEANYQEMKQRIENMGAVNMMALEEFNECDQRFTFLTRERDDLLQSITDTQQAIKELGPDHQGSLRAGVCRNQRKLYRRIPDHLWWWHGGNAIDGSGQLW